MVSEEAREIVETALGVRALADLNNPAGTVGGVIDRLFKSDDFFAWAEDAGYEYGYQAGYEAGEGESDANYNEGYRQGIEDGREEALGLDA